MKTLKKDIHASDSGSSNCLGVISGLTNPRHFNLLVMMIDNLAIHEAGHFVMYFLNCKAEKKLPRVYELSISPNFNKGHIMAKTDIAPEFITEVINSDLSEEFKAIQIANTRRVIKYCLAGMACEIINMELSFSCEMAIICERAILKYYKKDKKDKNSDLSKAVAFNVAIGGQQQIDDPLPLLGLLKEAVNQIALHWNKVTEVATKLEKEKIIEGYKLEAIIESWQQSTIS